MGGRTAGQIRDRLLAAGMDGATPAVVMSAVTRSNEKRWIGTVGGLADAVVRIGVDNPILIGVGQAFSQAQSKVESPVGKPTSENGPHRSRAV